MKVVIVEDEFRIREGLEKLTAKLSDEYEIAGTAENGIQGLELIRRTKPDIVITDIRMPEMDGLEMLTQVVQEKLPVKVIVLSAYSEFDYARRAMKLGVTEYLLKPLSYTDFAQAMKTVTAQALAEKQRKPAQIGTLTQMFSDILNRRIELSDEITAYLSNTYGVEKDGSFILVCLYLGTEYKNKENRARTLFKHILTSYQSAEELKYCFAECESKQAITAVIYKYMTREDLENWISLQVSKTPPPGASIGMIEVNGLENLASGFDRLYPYMDWNLSFSTCRLISYPDITAVQTDSCIYPILLDSKVKNAVAEGQWNLVREITADFHRCFRNDRLYVPREIKECYVRFLWVVIAMAKEVGNAGAKSVEQQQLLSWIMNAKVPEELESAAEHLYTMLEGAVADEDMHLIIKKAKRFVLENYRQGVTLETIGDKLNVTPEYLGTLFKRETGVSFSNFLKKVRIDRAKELLATTNMKTYEICEASGYTDTKYFSKVFREVTGMLPRDYRNTIK